MPSKAYQLEVSETIERHVVRASLIWGEGLAPVHGEQERLHPVLAALMEKWEPPAEEAGLSPIQSQVRSMLRHGAYKPSGRGKPASEFLLRAARDGTFPVMGGAVDVNNVVSLQAQLPGSVFDADRSGSHLLLRYGQPGETYVFNPSGQSIDLRDLLVVCRRVANAWTPCGNPVKDAMATKVRPETRDVVAVLYAPAEAERSLLTSWTERYADLLSTVCGAAAVGFAVTPG